MVTKVSSKAIEPGAITADKIAAGAVTADKVAAGVSLGSAAPTIATVTITDASYNDLDDTAVDVAGGYIRIAGTEFQSGCAVMIGLLSATSVTFASSTELHVQVPAQEAGTYPIYVINPDGVTAARLVGLTYSGIPSWVTGSTLPQAGSDNAYTVTLSATGASSYSLAAGSSLPTGLTLDTSTGVLSGTVTVVSDTTYTFTVNATDEELQDSPRTFSLAVLVSEPSVTLSPAISGKSTWVFGTDGNSITIPAGTTYTVSNPTPTPLSLTVKIWGGGGGVQGGYTYGTYVLAAGESIGCQAATAGGRGGGGASAIYDPADSDNVYAVAGGGGGNGDTSGGIGGGTSGGTGVKVTGWNAYGGVGGTQSAGGNGGSGDRGGGSPGTFRNGGDGGAPTGGSYQGGWGWGFGGAGAFKSGDGYQGGGGGGYYGGGGGGASAGGAGGGGGSGYAGGLVGGITSAGAGSDSDRGTAGDAGTAGKIMLIFQGS